jgi:RNA polymerase sigma factor (sigma-70 family)
MSRFGSILEKKLTSNEMSKQNQIWNRFIHGENEAIGELYTQLFEPLVFLSFYFVKSNESARDIVGDLFVQIITTTPKDRKQKWGDIKDIQLYLKQIVRHKSIDYLRKSQNQLRIQSDWQQTVSVALDNFSHEALNVLSLPEKDLFDLHLQGFNNNELAQKFHLSEKTIRNKLSLSRKKMLRYFKTVLILFS